jgi:ABC-type nitrate/sulfonate/bicarbonate transport system substrate-binding protein
LRSRIAISEELLVSSLAQTDALAKLLIEKGVITREEFMQKISEERATYQKEAQMEKSLQRNFVCKACSSKSFICLLLISLLLVPNLSWSAQPTVRMSQPTNSLGYLSIYAARANGYFNDEGITLELIIVQGGADIAAIISGSVDFSATSTGGLLRAFSGGTELLGVYNILGKCIYDLVIRKDTAKRLGITPAMPVQERLKRIKGTVIGAGSGIGVIPYQVAYFLAKEAGLEPGKDVTILAAGGGESALVALRTGHIDIMSYPPPFPQIAIKAGDAISLVANTKGEYPKLNSFQTGVLLVRPEYAKKNPDTVRRVVGAMVHGSRWVAENDAKEVAMVVAKFFRNAPPDVLLSTVETIKPAVIPDGRMDLDGLKGVEEVYRVNGVIKKPVPWDHLVTNEFLPQ